MAFEFKLPDIGEGVVEGEIVQWLVSKGDLLEEDQPMVEIMTDKATVELPSPRAGRVLERKGEEGEVIEVGDVLIVIEETDAPEASKEEAEKEEEGEGRRESVSAESLPEAGKQPAAKPEAARQAEEGEAKDRRKALATPAVRRVARQRDIDIQKVEGTGPGGRITREDLDRHEKEARKPAPPEEPKAPPPPEPAGEAETVPYRALRKKIGDRLQLSKRVAPHFTYVEEADMTQLVKLREQYREMPRSGDVKLTYLPFIVKAVIQGLKQFPVVNSSLDEEAGEIHVKKYYNIGIATATDKGLIVPVVKQADGKSVLELAEEIARLAQDARQGESSLEDLRDGTFTITSLGALGGIMATPIINHPEVAILGVHKIQEKPVVRGGEVVIRDMMNLSVSMDHRIVDGQTGAEFLNYVIPFLENPALLLL